MIPSRALAPRAALLAAALFAAATPVFAGDAAAAPAATGDPAANAPTYTINLSPAWKVGQKFGFISDGKRTMTQSMVLAGQTQGGTVEMSARLEADGEILAVFPNNTPQKVTLTVKSFRGSLGTGQPASELLPAGTVVVATQSDGGDTAFTVNGTAPGEAFSEGLDMILSLGNPRSTDQAIFGPTAPVAVGASWPVNGAALLAADPQMAQEMGATGATGTVKLVKITGTGADQVAEVAGSASLVGVKVPPPFTTKTAEFKMEMSGTVPASTTTGTMKQIMAMTMNIVGETPGPDGTPATLSVKATATGTEEFTFR